MTWQKAELDPHTKAFLEQEANEATEVVPNGFHLAFIRLSYESIEQAQIFVSFLSDHLAADPATTGLWLRRAEVDLLQQRLDMIMTAPENSGELSAVVYLQDLASNALRNSFQDAEISGEIAPTAPSLPAICGVIDDGIPFLNRRYRRSGQGSDSSRVLSLWMQKPGADALRGRVMERAEIASYFASNLGEATIYREVNRTLSTTAWHRRATDHRVTHGALVMDLAAGADPADASDPMRAVDILAVQLATQSVKDSSGRRLREGILRGVRWIVRRALQEGEHRPLVVNISLGAMDGPRVSTTGYAKLIEREAAYYKALSGQEMTITAAFGNAYRNRQVATAKPDGRLSNAALAKLTWRILPEDRTESLMQIRVIAPADRMISGTLSDVQIQIEAPGKPASPWMPLSDGASMISPDGTARFWCAVTSVDGGFVHVMAALVINPTAKPLAPDTGDIAPFFDTLAPAGGYIIRVQNTGAEVELALQIQRDDTPPGFAANGRQSYFDHQDSYGWDLETRDWTNPDASPITRQGSYSDLCAKTGETIKTVGALYQPFGHPVPRPARYSAEGTDLRVIGSTVGPDYSVVVDRSRFGPGFRASGVVSGRFGRLSGTSAAAPVLARHLLLDTALSGQSGPVDGLIGGRIGTVVGQAPTSG